jgi:hypothetical protein
MSSSAVVTISNRPGMPRRFRRPHSIASSGRSSAAAAATAARMFDTFGRPTRRDRTDTDPRGVRASKCRPESA